jgi:hypothetical protein
MSEQVQVRLGGISEISERTGRPRPVVCNWADRRTKGFPLPYATLSSGRVWDMDAVERWLQSHREMLSSSKQAGGK